MKVRKILRKIKFLRKINNNDKVNEIIAYIVCIKNFLFNKKELFVVGMPKSGSVFFHTIISDIVRQINHNINILNDSAHGQQHLTYSSRLRLNKYRQVFGSYRDLRDVIVSTYFYVMNHHKIGPDIIKNDPKQGTGKHPLYDSIKGLSFKESIDKLIFHENSLFRYNNWLMNYWDRPFVHLVKFEDITSENSDKIFQELFTKIGIEVPLGIIKKALHNNSLEKLHKKNPIHNRDGKIGKFRDFLSYEQIKKIEKTYNKFFKLTEYRKISV